MNEQDWQASLKQIVSQGRIEDLVRRTIRQALENTGLRMGFLIHTKPYQTRFVEIQLSELFFQEVEPCNESPTKVEPSSTTGPEEELQSSQIPTPEQLAPPSQEISPPSQRDYENLTRATFPFRSDLGTSSRPSEPGD